MMWPGGRVLDQKFLGVLLDVGGTLWPDHWARSDEERLERVCAAFPQLTTERAGTLLVGLGHALDEIESHVAQDTHGTVRAYCEQNGWTLTAREAVALRRAICTPALGHAELFPGALDLLRTIRALELQCIVVSNAISRAAVDYQEDFTALGVDGFIDSVVSSVDVGVRKPDPAIFERALATGQLVPAECILIGNSEHNDIQPALALGLYAIRVAIEEPMPAFTLAHRAVGSLHDAAAVLRGLVSNEEDSHDAAALDHPPG